MDQTGLGGSGDCKTVLKMPSNAFNSAQQCTLDFQATSIHSKKKCPLQGRIGGFFLTRHLQDSEKEGLRRYHFCRGLTEVSYLNEDTSAALLQINMVNLLSPFIDTRLLHSFAYLFGFIWQSGSV